MNVVSTDISSVASAATQSLVSTMIMGSSPTLRPGPPITIIAISSTVASIVVILLVIGISILLLLIRKLRKKRPVTKDTRQ